MWGRIHDNLDIDLYVPREEYDDLSHLESEKTCCELPTLDGSYSGRKAHLQCKDLREPDDVMSGEYKEGNYFITMARNILNLTDERGHFIQIDGMSVVVYVFEQNAM